LHLLQVYFFAVPLHFSHRQIKLSLHLGHLKLSDNSDGRISFAHALHRGIS